MKKIALCLALILLLLVGCAAPQTAGKVSDNETLPTLSGKELIDADLSARREGKGKPTTGEHAERPTLHRSEDETEPQEDDGVITVCVSELSGGSRRRQSVKNSWSFALPDEGTKSFGETVPLSVSATAEEDGTVTVMLLSEDCYVLNGKLPQKVEHIKLSPGETVNVTVRSGGTEVAYALRIE